MENARVPEDATTPGNPEGNVEGQKDNRFDEMFGKIVLTKAEKIWNNGHEISREEDINVKSVVGGVGTWKLGEQFLFEKLDAEKDN